MRARSKGNWLAAFCAAFCVLTAFAAGAWAGDSAAFVSKTVADNSSVTGGKSFKQEWTIKNTGSKTWDSDYKLRYKNGDLSSSHSSIKISGKVKPGKTYTFSMEMKAPAAKSTEAAYREEWKFGKSSDSTLIDLWTQIVVPKAVPVVTDDYGNSCSAAADISVNSSKNGKIDFAGDNDFFRIQVSSKGTLNVYTTGDTDTYGRLFDSNCNEIKHDDDDGKGDNFSISKSVSAGTYYVAVRHHSSTKTGNYVLYADIGNSSSGWNISDDVNTFVKKNEGKYIDMDGVKGAWYQCVDLMHAYIQDVLKVPRSSHNIRGNAYPIYTNIGNSITISSGARKVRLEKVANTGSNVPQKGDIIFWNTGIGKYGHVAIFLLGDKKSFVSLDQNFPIGSPVKQVKHSYNHVAGWLHPVLLSN